MLGKRIKEMRSKMKATQSYLAEMLDVDVVTVRRWESDTHQPHSSMVEKLCEVFGVTRSELIDG